MNIRSIALAVVTVLATSAAFAETSAPKAEPKPAPREQTLVEEISAGMRGVLRAVTPEISLPSVEVKLPTLDARKGTNR